MIKDYLTIVWNNFKNRRMRSFLTLIGIIIGVVAIILLYTAGQGLEDVAGSQFDKFGARQIIIGPKNVQVFGGGPQGFKGLTIDDAKFLKKMSEIELVTYIYRETAEIKFDKETYIGQIGASSTDEIEKGFLDSGLEAIEGRLIRDGDSQDIAVLGFSLAKEFFDKKIFVNQKILLNNQPYKVVGIMKKTGNQQDDNAVWIPYESGKTLFNITKEITAMAVTIKKGIELTVAEKKIKNSLKRKRNAEDFTVINPVQLQKQTKNVLGAVKLVIVAIGLISLFVGGIGIMNSMYTSVLERIREIGVMKAIGARKKDILTIFLIESSLMGLIGGLISIVISIILIYFMQQLFLSIAIVPIKITYNYGLFLFAILFSIITGIVAGMWPAIKASRLNPVDALRYE